MKVRALRDGDIKASPRYGSAFVENDAFRILRLEPKAKRRRAKKPRKEG